MNSTTTGIVQQFFDEAAFLWTLRGNLVDAPHFSLDDLERFDERLEAHLDGLRVAGDDAWETCRDGLSGGAEALFPAAVVAFSTGESNRTDDVINAVVQEMTRAPGVISALGWLPFEQVEPYISAFLAESSPLHHYIGLAASALHRKDPGQSLKKAVNDTFPLLIATGLRTYGDLGRGGELSGSCLDDYLSDEDDDIRFAAASSGALAGISKAVEALTHFASPKSSYAVSAVSLSMRAMRHDAALDWHRQLARDPASVRLAAIGAGSLGDPALAPWLIEQMAAPEPARVAAEAFTMITGADLEDEELATERPEGFNAGPTDDPRDTNVAMDADENLPWPDVHLLSAWWHKHKGRYRDGTRYLLGKPQTPEHLRYVLETGLQRQRAAAALELALINPGQPVFDIRAPAARQRKELENQ